MWLSALNLCVCICVCVCVHSSGWQFAVGQKRIYIVIDEQLFASIFARIGLSQYLWLKYMWERFFLSLLLMFCLHIHAHIAQIYYTHTESIAICGASNAMQSSLQTQGRVNQRAKPYGWVHKSQNTHTQHTVWPTATTTSLIRCRIILPQSLSSFFTAPFFIHSRKPCAVFICSHVYIYGH